MAQALQFSSDELELPELLGLLFHFIMFVVSISSSKYDFRLSLARCCSIRWMVLALSAEMSLCFFFICFRVREGKKFCIRLRSAPYSMMS